jgi:hypothetical protein
MNRNPIFGIGPRPVRQPLSEAPVWLWDPELETYILAREDVEWTEGHGPVPVVLPPEEMP